jgi:hypothetical protein
MGEREISEGTLELMVDAAFIFKDHKKVCPLTYKPVRRENCRGEHHKRMITCSGPCRDFCIPKLDDLKIQRYGGTSSGPQ